MLSYLGIHKACCDKCNKSLMKEGCTRKEFLAFLRSYGWTIGSKVLCEECKLTTISNSKEPDYRQLELEFNEEEENVSI